MKSVILYYSKGLIFPKGGAQSAGREQLIHLIKNLSLYEIDLIPITDYDEGIIEGIHVTNIFPKYMKYIPFNFIYENKYFEFYLNKKISRMIDFIHIHCYGPFYPNIKNVKVLMTLHDEMGYVGPKNLKSFPVFIEYLYQSLCQKIRISAIKNVNAVQCLSMEIYNQLAVINNFLKLELIPNGNQIEIPNLTKSQKDRICKYILFIGPIEFRKGFGELINIIKYLPINYQFLVIGKIAPIWGIHYLTRIINHPRIHFLGFVSNEYKNFLLSNVDLFFSNSKSEASQLAVIEALNVGCNVLMTNTGRNFYLKNIPFVNNNASPSIKAKKIIEVLQNPPKNILDNYPTWDDIAKDILGFYNKLLNNN